MTTTPEETPDTSPGITRGHGVGPFHVVAGMHIGAMGRLPPDSSITSVLTVAKVPGIVPDNVRHRHLPLDYQSMDEAALLEAVTWVLYQVSSNRAVLVRSETGRQRPALVVAMAILRLGGTYYDAVLSLRNARSGVLTDFRYLSMLKDLDLSLRSTPPRTPL